MTPDYNKVLIIPRGDNFDRLQAQYFGSEHYKDIHEGFYRPKFTVGKTDVAYRVINHWDQSGLLPDGFKNDGGWREFSLIEMAWLKIIQQLRNFGMSLDQIRKAKEGVIAWNSKSRSYPTFELYLSLAISSDLNVYAVVTEDGRGGLATDDEVVTCRALNDDPPGMLMISLKGIIKSLGFEVAPTSPDSDSEIVQGISGNVKAVKIEKKKSGKREIETTEEYPADSIKEIQKKLQESGAFGNLTIKYENGKEQSAEVKVRKRV